MSGTPEPSARLRFEPLSAPEILDLDRLQPPSKSVWARIPVIGAMIVTRTWWAHAKPIVQRVEQQLLQRAKPPPEVWGDDPARVELGAFISRVAQECMLWPNDHFVPDDPVYVVFWSYSDFLAIEDVVHEIEGRVQRKLQDHEVDAWFDATLGEVVDLLLGHQASGDEASPTR